MGHALCSLGPERPLCKPRGGLQLLGWAGASHVLPGQASWLLREGSGVVIVKADASIAKG